MKSGHDRIIAILMERDELTEEEAREQVGEAAELINEIVASGGSYEEAEEILLDDLGLEMDYIFDLLL
jgi:hypothetical protein